MNFAFKSDMLSVQNKLKFSMLYVFNNEIIRSDDWGANLILNELTSNAGFASLIFLLGMFICKCRKCTIE